METLAAAVRASIPAVKWFALGDAKRIAAEMEKTVRAYDKQPSDPVSQEKLTGASRQAIQFLRARATTESTQTAHTLEVALAKLNHQGESKS